jgi:hypothetical protein
MVEEGLGLPVGGGGAIVEDGLGLPVGGGGAIVEDGVGSTVGDGVGLGWVGDITVDASAGNVATAKAADASPTITRILTRKMIPQVETEAPTNAGVGPSPPTHTLPRARLHPLPVGLSANTEKEWLSGAE